MPSFDFTPSRVPLNPLLDYADLQNKVSSIQIGQNQADTGTQDLADRATLRGVAAGLSTRDAMAMGTAASLGASGQGAVSTLATADAQTAASKLAALQYTANLPNWNGTSGGTLGGVLPMAGAATTGTPATGTPATGTPVAANAASSDIENRLQSGESGGKAGVVNGQGYSGLFQFGTGRLSDLKMYQPLAGENPNGNQWKGAITIPGFSPMSHQQFLANPDAQRAAMHVHVADINQAISQTPGADKMNRDGLIAVAHLGGVQGMQQFVQSGGQYNPADSNRTRLSDYYSKYSQAGLPQLAADHGHPAGPLPGYDPSQVNPSGGAAQVSGPNVAPTGSPVQLASNTGAAGMPQTATDASGGVLPAAAPMSQNNLTQRMAQLRQGADPAPMAAPMRPDDAIAQANTELAGKMGGLSPEAANAQVTQRAQEIMQAQSQPVQVASAPVTVPNPLAQPGPQPADPTQAAPIALAPAAPAAPQTAPQGAQPGVMSGELRPGERIVTTQGTGAIYTQGLPAGFAYAVMPDGSRRQVPIPNTQKLEVKDSGPLRSFIDPIGGQTVRTEAIPDHSRPVFRDVAGGTQQYQSGKPVGPVIPYSGRPEQETAYKADVPRVGEITASTQAAQTNAPRLNEMADLAQELKTGPTAEVRAKAAQYLESMGVSNSVTKTLTGMESGSASQVFLKLATQIAGADAKQNVGSNNGIQSIQLYQTANPGLQLLPDANKRVTNMMRVANQATQDYGQGAVSHFGDQEDGFLHKGAAYTPLTAYNRVWQAQNNPQVYAAATGMLNGDSFDKWSARVTPDQAKRAAGIASRIDPNAMVPARNGQPIPARVLAGSP